MTKSPKIVEGALIRRQPLHNIHTFGLHKYSILLDQNNINWHKDDKIP